MQPLLEQLFTDATETINEWGPGGSCGGRGVHLLFLLSVSEIKAGDLPEINTLHKKRQNVKKQNKKSRQRLRRFKNKKNIKRNKHTGGTCVK